MEQESLKPCPFCPPDKSDVSIYEVQRFSFTRPPHPRYGIECVGCGTMMEGPEMWGFETKEKATDAWNVRYEREPLRETVSDT